MKQLENSKNLSEDRHCSNCKYYTYILSRFMYCTKLQHRIYASRKNRCKNFEQYNNTYYGKEKD